MFKNKAVQMKFVKETPETIVPKDPERLNQIADVAIEFGRETVRGAAILISTYVAADTVRRTIVHIIATKIN